MSTNAKPEVVKQENVTILVFGTTYQSLNDQHLATLTSTVREAVQTADPPLVVFDLSSTTYFASDFLSILIDGWKRLKDRDGARVAVCGLTTFAQNIFTVAKLEKLWEIYPTRENAVQALS